MHNPDPFLLTPIKYDAMAAARAVSFADREHPKDECRKCTIGKT